MHSAVPLTPFGGDEENRTPDPLLARQVLSQLSYTPKRSSLTLDRFASRFLFENTACISFRVLLAMGFSYSFVILPAVALALITHYALRIPNCLEVNPQN